MSAKQETTFIRGVHIHLPAEVYSLKNNNPYASGIADCWYSGLRADLWVEYKFEQLPVRDTTVMDLIGGNSPSISRLQQDWLRARHVEGRAVGVIVGSPKGGVWFPGISWDRTYTAGEFRSWIEDRASLAKRIHSLVG